MTPLTARSSSLFLVTFWLILVLQGANSEIQEVCDSETFAGRCESGQVMVVKSARYGRMSLGRCVKVDLGYLGCYTDVLSLFDGWCSGNPSCDVNVDGYNENLIARRTCIADLSSYVIVEYECTRAAIYDATKCRADGKAEITASHGILASHVTDESGCGGLSAPWIIKTSPGQRVSISMADFGWTEEDRALTQPKCQAYGYISEPDLGVNQTVCGGLAREQEVYKSASSEVVIQILLSQQRKLSSSFLLQYTVIGCPDMTPPSNAWYKRNDGTAVIGCEWSEHSWHLKCEGNTWVGVVGNCSSGVVSPPATSDHAFKMPAILSVGLIIGLAVLVVVLLCVVIFGYICCRRRPVRKVKHPSVGMTAPEYDGQAFLYYPGRPVPIQGHCTLQGPHPMAMGGITQEQFKPSTADELLHIWETPLPDPVTNQQDDSGIVSEPTYASLPSRGTMTGPCQPQRTMPRVATNDGVNAGDVTWPGTRAFYDQGAGWVAIPDSN